MALPERKRRISVFIDEQTWNRLRELAFRTQVSMSEFCYEAIITQLDSEDESSPANQ